MMGVNKKRKEEEEEHEGINESVNTMDRISQLPQPIIHDILCLLPTKDVARTSILSKTWLHAWASFPNFDFDENYFEANESNRYFKSDVEKQAIKRNKDKFMNFIDETLQRYLEHNLRINKFRLCMGYQDLELNMASHVDQWVSFAIERNVKELDLQIDCYRLPQTKCVYREKEICYNLPQIVFDSTTITVLKLCRCNLMPYGDIKLSNLQKLCLERLYIDDHILENVTSSCPSIKDLSLIFCHGLNNLKISSLLQINRIQLYAGEGLEQVKIGTRSLQTFQYCGGFNCREIDLKACEILKELNFRRANITDQLLQDFSSKFPDLEVLVLDHCRRLKNIDISSQKLKRLVLRYLKLEVARIDTPNLTALEYAHNLISSHAIHTPKLREVELQFYNKSDWDTQKVYHYWSKYPLWYDELKVFLEKFANFNGLTLVIQFDKIVIIHEDLRGIVLPPQENFKNLKVSIKITSMNLSALPEELTYGFKLSTLSIVSSSNSKLLKILYEEPRFSFATHEKPVPVERPVLIDKYECSKWLRDDIDKYERSNWLRDDAEATLLKLYDKMQYKISTFKVKRVRFD